MDEQSIFVPDAISPDFLLAILEIRRIVQDNWLASHNNMDLYLFGGVRGVVGPDD